MGWLFAVVAKVLVMAAAVYLTAAIVPGIKLRSAGAAVSVALVYGVLNFFLGKALFMLTLPLAIITLGAVVNAILLFLTGKLNRRLLPVTLTIYVVATLLKLFGLAGTVT